jgi:NodT family efflux transporter outer membrane factor (OMF) lipoprotein
MGPDYVRPSAPTAPAFKELAGWRPAAPREAASGEAWWAIYGDPVLDDLMKQVDVSNQTLKANEAAVRQAQAVTRETRAGFWPTVSLDGGVRGSPNNSGGSSSSGVTSGGGLSLSNVRARYDLSASADWEIDLWGRVRRAVESDTASAQAAQGDLAAARLSVQSQIASDYFSLRARDAQKRLLDEAANAYEESLRITRNQYRVGLVARGDVAQAETQLLQTRAQAIAVGVQRAQFEHAIAVLVGKAPAEFSLAAEPMPRTVPVVPAGLPSALLERRPDVAAAERRMAAANAEIGVAEAAYYPDITLSATIGVASTAIGNLFAAANRGAEAAAAASELLFDFGARKARTEQARAAYDQTLAVYRETVLTAFQQVEDQLAALHFLQDQARVQAQALAAAREAEKLELNQYRAGTIAYTSVVTAQQTALNNAQTMLSIRESRLLASVGLVTSLGGDWSQSDIGIASK